MSSLQWAGIMRGDESYAGARSWFVLRDRLQELTGFEHILPTHQGRASERILFELVGGPGKVVPNNSHFDTTRANVEHSGAKAVDLVIDEGKDPRNRFPFKGNLDVAKLEALIKEVGRENIPLVMITVTNNSGGGQPVSMENIRAVRAFCDRHKLPLFLDACRFAENAYFIKTREPGYQDRSVREIVREMFDLADGATISAKKDGFVNIGGLLLLRDAELVRRADELLILTEGFLTYGGLAWARPRSHGAGFRGGRARGLPAIPACAAPPISARSCLEAGIQIVEPPGGHAIYIDAKHFCPHIPPGAVPRPGIGVRAVSPRRHSRGRDRQRDVRTGAARLRRWSWCAWRSRDGVYTQSHVDYAIEVIIEAYEQREQLRPLEIVEEPPSLRHFTARFREL